MPPRVARLEAELDVRPGDVNVDQLARVEHERMLTLRLGETNVGDGLDHIELEPALRGPLADRIRSTQHSKRLTPRRPDRRTVSR